MKENHKVDELLGNIAKLKSAIDEKDEIIVGLVKSKEENAEIIKGLEESLKETEQYLKKTVEDWKKMVDDIYNSATWKIASKFTRGQTKRKKN